MEGKIDKFQNLIKNYEKDGKSLILSNIDQDDINQKEKEILFLTRTLEEIKKSYKEEISKIEKNNFQLQNENENLKENFKKIQKENQLIKKENSILSEKFEQSR